MRILQNKVAIVTGASSGIDRATAEEIAQSALYLASDTSSFTTGTAMLVNVGVPINKT